MLELTSNFSLEMIKELEILQHFKDVSKDIIIVVKDQLSLFENCIKSIEETTKNYNIYIWDNASNEETKNYISSIKNAHVVRSEENLGFIKPNNELIKLGTSPYVILLNSDTIVSHDWDKALISWLQAYPDVGATGYSGAVLNDKLEGERLVFGSEADYIEGWCLAFRRETYNQLGLFDENLQFAYCEDADFCLKLKENNLQTYILHLNLVFHYGHATIRQVGVNNSQTFIANHKYMQQKWLSKLPKLRNYHYDNKRE